MSAQPPDDDAKTVLIGTGRDATPPDAPAQPDDPATVIVAAVETGGSDANTLLIQPAGNGPARAGAPVAPGVRLPPAARLPWPARDQARAAPTYPPVAADEATRLVGASRLAPATSGAGPGMPRPDEVDAVVGWLVIVAGPGKGRGLEVGAGANDIGRDAGQKIRLDFGDLEIHRERHAVLIYDERARRFFLKAGDVRNLTYLDDELVLTPQELKGGEIISLGATRLHFVPFCGPEFGWV